jgi:hypothetical protein
MVPTPTSTVPAVPRVSWRRIAIHHLHTSSTPRMTRVLSLATSRIGPSHDGASATSAVNDRYPDAETPLVTATAPASPSPPGESQAITPAATVRIPAAADNRSRLMEGT